MMNQNIRFLIQSIPMTALCALLCVLPGCTRSELEAGGDALLPEGTLRLEASAESPDDTRTAISSDTGTSGLHISWTSGDAAKVFYAGGNVTASVDGVSASGYSEDNRTATFVASIPAGATDLYAVYPSSATSSYSDGALSVTIPSTQTGTFTSANYMVCKSTRASATLPFRHLASYMEINVGNASVTKIVIASENGAALAGTLPVTFDADGIPQPGTVSSPQTNITINVSGTGYYYAALLPAQTHSGLSVRFYDSAGNILNSYCHQNSFTPVRGQIHDFSRLDNRTRYLYATVSGAGDKDGSSWANAMSKTELYEFLNNAKLKQNGVLTVLTDAQKNALDGATVRLGAGTYTMTDCVNLQNICTATNKTFSLVGGYPAAGGQTADPSTNVTAFSGSESHRILDSYVDGTDKKLTLNLSGITFCNGKAAPGGAAVVRFYGAGNTVAISDCIFSNNTNTGTSACLHVATGSTVTLTGCTFQNNQAYGAAAANIDGNGAKAYFTDCTFTGNQASASGGACKISSGATNAVMNFTNCTFTANKGGDYGGAFYCNAPASASANFTDCTFGAQNDATKKNYADTYGGGAVYIGDGGTACTITFDGCNFYGNTAKSGGGAIHVSNGLNASSATCLSNVNLTDCIFEDNYVTNDASTVVNGCGGAVDFRSSGTLLVSGCTFKNNYTTRTGNDTDYLASGGAICISDGNLTEVVDETTVPVYATVKITGTTFEGNHTANSKYTVYHMNCGGALAVICGNDGTTTRMSYANVYVDKCNFLDNYANQGGALFLGGAGATGGTCFVNDCLFDGNYIKYRYGTTINAYRGGTLCINNSTFHNTYVTGGDKGMWRCWINYNQTNFFLSNSTLIGQTQGSSGDTADDTGTTPSLIRFDTGDYNSTYWAAFHTNLIVNTKATDADSNYYTLINSTNTQWATANDSPHTGFRAFIQNKLSHLCTTGGGFNFSSGTRGAAHTTAAYQSTLTGLTWNQGNPRTYANTYWSWTTCTANGTFPVGTNIKNDLNKTCPDFYTWLTSGSIDGVAVNGLSKDQRGTSRPADSDASWRTGAIQ
ncbi:MAG: hypothetical protein IJR34_00045 [Bacteroidales bacterium]|nr:hypothetical protein [Bacteroidales bacterium]